MSILNFEDYFNTLENKYYNPKILITILEDILGKGIDTIKDDVCNAKVFVTREQIEAYLDKTFESENPELKRRIENPKPRRSNVLLEWTRQDIEDSSQEFVDQLSANRYHFEPYSLEYFNRYTTIVKDKAILLLNIIEKIANKECSSIQDLITKIDIQLDENGNISNGDIVRLITPTVYNINTLNEKIYEANDLSTYLTFKLSKHSLYREGFSEGEIYPTTSIQIQNLHYGDRKGNVPLSTNQRNALHEEQSRNIKKASKILFNLF